MKQETKRTIYEAALKVFSANGFEKTTVNEIAEAAGIAKGTIYYNFNSKRELFLAIIDDGIEELAKRMRKGLDEEVKVIEKLKEIIGAQLSFFEEYKSYSKVLLSEVLWGLEDRWQEEAAKIREQLFAQVERLIIEGIQEGELQPELDPNTISSAIFGMTAVAGFNAFLFKEDYSLKKMENDLQRLLIKGLQRCNQNRAMVCADDILR